MILTDLQKAFDTINYNILLKKCLWLDFLLNELHGLDCTSLIEDFKSTSKIGTTMLLTSTVEYIPQASILGPLLFLLYVNDIPQAVDFELFL